MTNVAPNGCVSVGTYNEETTHANCTRNVTARHHRFAITLIHPVGVQAGIDGLTPRQRLAAVL